MNLLGYLARDLRELPPDFHPEWIAGFRGVFLDEINYDDERLHRPVFKQGAIAAELLMRCYPFSEGGHILY
jgi:hypothetical protein